MSQSISVPDNIQDPPEEVDKAEETIQPTKDLKPWNPINEKFYHDDSDDETSYENDDKDTVNAQDYQRREIRDTVGATNTVGMVWNITDDEDVEPEWDNSPEQYQLQEDDAHSEEFELRPRRLFAEVENNNDLRASTEETSDDEVFERIHFQSPVVNPRLKRRNAMRQKPSSEPRITRNMVQSGNYGVSISNPTSPSLINLTERQNLERVLIPNHPLVPEQVQLAPVVQNLNGALENMVRRSRRVSARIDYKRLHEGEGKFRKGR